MPFVFVCVYGPSCRCVVCQKMDQLSVEAFNNAVPGPVEPPRPDKEPDAIKLFVGQVPKTFDEKDLRPYLEHYGPIHELSILRDKVSHAHKGKEGYNLLMS